MTVTGYLSLQGYCYGGNLTSLVVPLYECGEQCDAHSDCRGYNYILESQSCILKKIMCRSPSPSEVVGCIAYYKIGYEGKLLHLCKI